MVCSLGSGRMAVMARLLASGSVTQSIAEEVGHQKFDAQMICRELSDANEANLLDEEDMHVFGLKPMDDPLHLVCCNACKRPVKASQYVEHAELCRSLNAMQETTLEPDGSMGQRKPPRKEKKKLLTAYANQSTSVGELERSESVEADDIAVSQPQLDGQIGMNSCCFMETKRNSAYVDATYMMDGSGVSPGNTNGSTCVMLPPTKRSKMVAGEQLPLSDDIGIVSAVSKLTSTQDACPYRDSSKGVISVSDIPNDSALKYKKSGQALECCMPIKDCPLPLATKVYYSQKSNRLRSALCHLYHEAVASTKELCSDMILIAKQRDSQSLPSMRKPDQILAQNSEVCLGNSVGSLPDGDFSNQFPVDNVPRPQVAGVGLTRSKILSKPYSFAGSSGQSLGTMQQQNGSVHVI
ncbi:hypothetical protein PRUPE_1G142600 [Prunus persica]|uniref:SCA7 domain-containing protein n=1 Tax=Prunus persica TaxID=3760 RepID=A0A251QX96_PRUPE|nr:uncharacterized protein LOC18790028 isoform X1 [Prunus persica]XP_020416614.1 uncharacterized protein LOC18790028 isoform X1 [Prunus persica]XP_020416622.1 uncharacterized protein LOC18790028 isoform X1 [Prunus persica]ONI28448.1 hypothetical protein PRUPE_1G142600 [Prunus persica]ONI28449.1 hypothetical protein PRUPE_1G142600 [Prunus persica]ONI28450.1 hypothetical protein PRUPE_1G142600 [Prunus persica]ONI28451.1 hypothetical protein PRUPE_1G142600 [Prunus persica]ONI28452.1 hypothetica